MDSEDRPRKIRKLSHDGDEEQSPSSRSHEQNGTQAAVTLEPTVVQPAAVTESNVEDQIEADDAEPTADENAVSSSNDPAQLSTADGAPTQPPLSKNQLKKLRKKQEWEAGRQYRKQKQKEKMKEKKAQRREKWKEAQKQNVNDPNSATTNGDNSFISAVATPRQIRSQQHRAATKLPITFLIDCDFDDKMSEKEMISLGGQVTRCYSDNYRAPFQAQMVVSSWGGQLKERFETAMRGMYHNWKDVAFMSEDFVEAAEKSKMLMVEKAGEEKNLRGVFEQYARPAAHRRETNQDIQSTPSTGDAEADQKKGITPPEPEIIYLTSDSPNTLTSLAPHSVYIIGGIVDKNRHKGICYQRAAAKGIKTAKLPIGEIMEMQSRFVLATNHVFEIMLRWLECGDWGEAFLRVIPKRKGGKLKGKKDEDEVSRNVEEEHGDQDVEGAEEGESGNDDDEDVDDQFNEANEDDDDNQHEEYDQNTANICEANEMEGVKDTESTAPKITTAIGDGTS